MGTILTNTYYEGTRPSIVPDVNEKPTFDPNFGFKKPRKERVSPMTYEEMKSTKLRKERRNYCTHLWVDYMVCYEYYKPFYGFCNPEFEAFHHCKYEDFVLRMKEYEREKRLRIREAKLKGALA